MFSKYSELQPLTPVTEIGWRVCGTPEKLNGFRVLIGFVIFAI